MRFLTLLHKELRECLPWMLLAMIILFAIGGFSLRAQVHYGYYDFHHRYFSPGSSIEPFYLTHSSPLAPIGPLLFVIPIGLGLVLGLRQFWIPNFTKTWPFLLHRSTNRKNILAAKLIASLIAFIISTGFIWIVFYWYASRPELFILPQTLRVLIHGWIFIILGFVTYLGTALSGLSTARWYTTKIFGLAFATIAIITTISQWSLAIAFIVIIISAIILLIQIFVSFQNREF
jgi:hypothetical protein